MNRLRRLLKSKTYTIMVIAIFSACVFLFANKGLIAMKLEGEYIIAGAMASSQMSFVAWKYHEVDPEVAKNLLNDAKEYGSFVPYIILNAIERLEHLGGKNISDMTLDEISKIDVSWRDESTLMAIQNLNDVELNSYLNAVEATFKDEIQYYNDSTSTTILKAIHYDSMTTFSKDTKKKLRACHEKVTAYTETWTKYSWLILRPNKGACIDLFFEDKKSPQLNLFATSP